MPRLLTTKAEQPLLLVARRRAPRGPLKAPQVQLCPGKLNLLLSIGSYHLSVRRSIHKRLPLCKGFLAFWQCGRGCCHPCGLWVRPAGSLALMRSADRSPDRTDHGRR